MIDGVDQGFCFVKTQHETGGAQSIACCRILGKHGCGEQICLRRIPGGRVKYVVKQCFILRKKSLIDPACDDGTVCTVHTCDWDSRIRKRFLDPHSEGFTVFAADRENISTQVNDGADRSFRD